MSIQKTLLIIILGIVLLWEISIAFSVPTITTSSSITPRSSSLSRRKTNLKAYVLRSIQMKDNDTTFVRRNNGRKRILIESSLLSAYNNNNSNSNSNESDNQNDITDRRSDDTDMNNNKQIGKLEALKQLEAELASQLALVRQEKLRTIQSRPLTIGIIGFGRFGQFIAKTFTKYGNVIVTSRSDYTSIAQSIGATYVPLSDPEAFLAKGLDVIVIAVSIVSFDATIQTLAPYIQKDIDRQRNQILQSTTNVSQQPYVHGPLIVDVLSVKEHPRNVMLQYLPIECDILCTHPMFGPDSGKDSWRNLNFVYEKTRIDKVVLDQSKSQQQQQREKFNGTTSDNNDETFIDNLGMAHSVHEDTDAHVEGMDRMERFLSIWEEEGCHMVPLSCYDHDAYAANSQFITHLIGRVLGSQGLSKTPIDTSGFQSVLKLIDTTTADSFDLFYGLYKYNQNSYETIKKLQAAMDDVVQNLKVMEQDANDEQ